MGPSDFQPSSEQALPATPFEWYMLTDHSTRHPMNFVFCFAIRGDLNVAQLQRAFLLAIEMHPLLTSVAVPTSAWPRYEWRKRDLDLSAMLDERDPTEGLPARYESDAINPMTGVTCRMRIYNEKPDAIESERAWTVAVEFHHAVSDGLRALEFCSDVFFQYERMSNDSTSVENGCEQNDKSDQPAKESRRTIAPQLLVDRGIMDRRIPHPVSRGTAMRFLALELVKFLFAFPVRMSRLSRNRKGNPTRDSIDAHAEWSESVREVIRWQSFGLSHLEFSPEVAKTLREFAQQHGGSLNNLLLAVTLRAFANQQRGWFMGIGSWVAVLPVNMIRASKQRVPCHNGIGYAFLRRKRDQCVDWFRNFLTLKTDIDAIQDWKLAGLFLDALDRLQRLPKWLANLVLWGSRPGSFVWSYVGDPLRRFPNRLQEKDGNVWLGGAKLEGLSAAPPTRPGTELAILATLWQDSIRLYFRFDEQEISVTHAKWLRYLVAKEVLAVVESIRAGDTFPG
ncbi:MAG: hypothetical protein ACK5PB_01890 [Pirellula sp.]